MKVTSERISGLSGYVMYMLGMLQLVQNIAMPFQKFPIILYQLYVAKQHTVAYFNQYEASVDVVRCRRISLLIVLSSFKYILLK